MGSVLGESGWECGAGDVVGEGQAWQRVWLLRELRAIYGREQPTNAVSDGWIVTAAPALQSS